MNKVIVTATCHPYLLQAFTAKGFEVDYFPAIKREELLELIGNYQVLITTTSIKIDKALIDVASKLQFIGRLGSGMEHIDVLYAENRSIKCVSSPEGNCNAVAEHSVGLLLSLMNNLNKSANDLQQGFYKREENRGEELWGKTVGIIGFGHTGSSFAQLLSSFKVTVLANDIYKSNFDNNYIKQVELIEIMHQADVISFHLPLTNLTKYMANESFFNGLKKQPYLINTSRGEVIHTAHLIEAIKNKKLKAVGLDVLENEKLATYTTLEQEQLDFLLAQKNVIITPHIAGYSNESLYKVAKVIVDKFFDNN